MKGIRKNTNKVGLALFFVALLAAGVLYYYDQFPTGTSSQSAVCKDFDLVTNVIKSGLEGDYKITVRDYYHDTELNLSWRENLGEPFRQYSGQKRTINLYGQVTADVAKKFEGMVVPEVEYVLGKKDALNNDPFPGRFNPDFERGTYGFKNGNSIYVVELYGSSTDSIINRDGTTGRQIAMPENSTVAEIICGEANAQYDDIYEKVMIKEKYDQSVTISIWELKDKLVRLNVLSLSGYLQYWIVDGSRVEKIGQGQDTPPCDLFESRKVGKGVECYDVQRAITRMVSY